MKASFYFESFEERKEEFKPMKIRCAEISSFSDVAPKSSRKRNFEYRNFQESNRKETIID